MRRPRRCRRSAAPSRPDGAFPALQRSLTCARSSSPLGTGCSRYVDVLQTEEAGWRPGSRLDRRRQPLVGFPRTRRDRVHPTRRLAPHQMPVMEKRPVICASPGDYRQ